MKNLPENELYSAYLDGELTAEEQSQVEQRLADSPAARQLLDELRALSSTLQRLPEYKLNEDFGEAVLRHAEREMLTRPVSSTETPPGRRLPDWRRFINARSLAWSGMAVAMAILLMVFNPQDGDRPGGREVAQGPKPEPASAIEQDRGATDRVATDRVATDRGATDRGATDRIAENGDREDGFGSEDRLGVARHFEPPSIGAAADLDADGAVKEPDAAVMDGMDAVVAGGGTGGEMGDGGTLAGKQDNRRFSSAAEHPSSLETAPSGMAKQGPTAKRGLMAEEGPAAKKGDLTMTFARKPAPIDVVDAPLQDAPVQDAPMSGHGFASNAVNGPGLGSGSGPGSAAAPRVSKGQGPGYAYRDHAVNAPPVSQSLQLPAVDANGTQQSVDTPSFGISNQLFAGIELAQNTNGHATVTCEISPAVLQRQSFERLLGENEIAVGEVALRRTVRLKKQGGSQAVRIDLSKASGAADSPPDGDPAVLNGNLGDGTLTLGTPTLDTLTLGTLTLDEATISQWGDADQLDVFYVEATASQIQATLKDLQRQRDTFRELSVQLAPNQQPPSQQQLFPQQMVQQGGVGAEQWREREQDFGGRAFIRGSGGQLAQTTEPAQAESLRPQAAPFAAKQPGDGIEKAKRGEKPEDDSAPGEELAAGEEHDVGEEMVQQRPAEQEASSAKAGGTVPGGIVSGPAVQRQVTEPQAAEPQVTGPQVTGPQVTGPNAPADETSTQSADVQSSASSRVPADGPSDAGRFVQGEPTYRVLFVLRVVGGESSNSVAADAAAPVSPEEAESQAGPALVDPGQVAQPAVEATPAQVPAAEQ